MNVVKKLYANGVIEEVSEKMSLADMQRFVGGYIERVPTTVAHRALIVNEDGISKGLPPNIHATAYLKPETLRTPDGILGDALLVKA